MWRDAKQKNNKHLIDPLIDFANTDQKRGSLEAEAGDQLRDLFDYLIEKRRIDDGILDRAGFRFFEKIKREFKTRDEYTRYGSSGGKLVAERRLRSCWHL